MLRLPGPAQPSPMLSMPDTLSCSFVALGCDTHQTVALDIVQRPKSAPIQELGRYTRCRDCSLPRG
jgi:hypothetical protein